MPVKFDPELLSVIPVEVKSLSIALGGSIRIVDDEDKTDVKGLLMDIPYHLVRRFKGVAGATKFIVPNKAEVIMYGDQPVCFERFPYAAYKTEQLRQTMPEDLKNWKSWSQRILDRVILPYIQSTSNQFQWCIDGYFIYALPKNQSDWVKSSSALNAEGTFRALRVKGFKLVDFASGKLTKEEKPEYFMQGKDCLVYKAPDGSVFVTPPIWNHLGEIGSKKLAVDDKGNDDDEVGSDVSRGERVDNTLFDTIDKDLMVNISFALESAAKLSKRFGFECVEPLQLPELMVAYTTVNLKSMPKGVKQTGPCGIQFTHTLAWLFGLYRDTADMTEMLEFRSILKYLTGKGIQHSQVVALESIYTEEFLSREDKTIAVYSEEEIAEIKVQSQRSDLMQIARKDED